MRGGAVQDVHRGIRRAVAAFVLAFFVAFGQTAPSSRAQDSLAMAETPTSNSVLTGIDVLAQDNFAALAGLRVGLLTHKAGRDRSGRRTVDVLAAAPGVKLVRLFSPEHGLGADREGEIAADFDQATRLPIVSLYGASKRPDAASLAGLDAIVVDLQDVGVRFYTYATTMAYMMEAAAKARLKVIVLDRPNPIGAAGAQGPVLDRDQRSFVGYFQMPIQHGMTLGELARLFNGENGMGADLSVIGMRGYKRASWFDETGLAWVSPSPNLRKLAATVLYPGIGMLEFTNLSVGRGTPTPFEVVGAPWIDGPALASALQRRRIAGVRITAVDFTPKSSRFAGQRCAGVRISLQDRGAVDANRLGIELAVALRRLHPAQFESRDLIRLLGSREVLAAIDAGKEPSAIEASWQPALRAFRELQGKYLIY